jgi:hypothetical protein
MNKLDLTAALKNETELTKSEAATVVGVTLQDQGHLSFQDPWHSASRIF